ncbi:MAG: hypothetical protein ACTS47_02950 [Candidatus Hodgkinia cicadicola]
MIKHRNWFILNWINVQSKVDGQNIKQMGAHLFAISIDLINKRMRL